MSFKNLGLTSLKQRLKYIDLLWLYKIIHGLSSITKSDLGITVASGDHVLRNRGYTLYLKNSFSRAVLFGFTYRSAKLWNTLPTKFYTTSLSVLKRNIIKFQ